LPPNQCSSTGQRTSTAAPRRRGTDRTIYEARSHAPRVDQSVLLVVVAEEQRPESMPRTLWIGPSDIHTLGSVKAFKLCPTRRSGFDGFIHYPPLVERHHYARRCLCLPLSSASVSIEKLLVLPRCRRNKRSLGGRAMAGK